MMKSAAVLLALTLCLAATAQAHVTVSPRESSAGAHEKYVVRVPTEGQVATESVELQLPAGLTLVSMAAPHGYTYELKRAAGRVVSIVWSAQIKPGEFVEFAFMARNPKDAATLVWKAVQRFADGTSTEWTGPAGDKHPASVTQLNSAHGGHSH